MQREVALQPPNVIPPKPYEELRDEFYGGMFFCFYIPNLLICCFKGEYGTSDNESENETEIKDDKKELNDKEVEIENNEDELDDKKEELNDNKVEIGDKKEELNEFDDKEIDAMEKSLKYMQELNEKKKKKKIEELMIIFHYHQVHKINY